MQKQIKKIYSITVTLFLFELVILLMFFRPLRRLSPPPEITKVGTVGFAHYFGYPFYFETIVFWSVFLSPIIIVGILSSLSFPRRPKVL